MALESCPVLSSRALTGLRRKQVCGMSFTLAGAAAVGWDFVAGQSRVCIKYSVFKQKHTQKKVIHCWVDDSVVTRLPGTGLHVPRTDGSGSLTRVCSDLREQDHCERGGPTANTAFRSRMPGAQVPIVELLPGQVPGCQCDCHSKTDSQPRAQTKPGTCGLQRKP